MKKGIHYNQTYAPVCSWNAIRLLLPLVAIHNWHNKKLYYVLAFPDLDITEEGTIKDFL